MNKKETISERLKKVRKRQSLTAIAKQYDTDMQYVSQIARGVRNPIRGKGLKIKKALEELIKK